MSLIAPNLDDLRFQRDLVDEARKRIIQYCPEWTEYNLSDPGITLIELFSWMTEMMVYRLNRVPEMNYLKFLEMLGMKLMPASSARTDLTFWLSAGLPLTPGDNLKVLIPRGFEVRTDQTEEEVIFTTDQDLEISPPVLTHVRKEEEFNKNYFPRLGLETFYPFDRRNPSEGDAFYLGFDNSSPLSGHNLRLSFACDPTEAVGIRRSDPPWVWEYQTAEGKWKEIALSTFEGEQDTTGGLNNEEGQLVVYLPYDFETSVLYGLSAFWLRCRIEQKDPNQGMYTESPRVKNIQVETIGATIPASHSVIFEGEILGTSNGEAGQTFQVENFPVLNFQAGETVEVEEERGGDLVFVPWTYVDDFAKSTRFDRHFSLDLGTGLVAFGPSVRQPDGSVVQYGRIPESGRTVRITAYRAGGGTTGNLPERNLNSMTVTLPFVSRVSNLVRARGGRDMESLDEMKLRAQRELQAQRRAVTAQDYEQFTKNFSRKVARAYCLTPNDSRSVSSGTISVLVVPAVADSLIVDNLIALHLDDAFRAEIQTHLDQFRLLTTSVNIREPRYTGVKVKVKIVPDEFANLAKVSQRVEEEIRRYLAPLRMDDKNPVLAQDTNWEGWGFGRDLFTTEVVSLIQQIPSVKYVLDVQVLSRPVVPVEENSIFDDEPEELSVVERVLRIPEDGLLCSLDHEIEIVEFSEMEKEN